MRILLQGHGTYKWLSAEVVQARPVGSESEQLAMVGLNRSFLGPIRLKLFFFFPGANSPVTHSGSRTSSRSSIYLD